MVEQNLNVMLPDLVVSAAKQLIINCRVPERNEFSTINYMGVIFHFDDPIPHSISQCKGLGELFSQRLASRFEIRGRRTVNKVPLKCLTNAELEVLEVFLMRTIPNKFDILEQMQLNILRKFAIRSYQGLCHAHGKPIHGQRTWSNASTAYKRNKVVREFLAERKKIDKEFIASLLLKEQSKSKRRKKRRKKSTKGTSDPRPLQAPVKVVKQFRSGRRAIRKKKKKFDVWC